MRILLFFTALLLRAFVVAQGCNCSNLYPETDSLTLIPATTGIPPDSAHCSRFLAERSWLPDAFIANAICACRVTPDEPKANRIRLTLQRELDNIPDSLRKVAAVMKAARLEGKISRHRYRCFVRRELTPQLYTDHILAYQQAGCREGPAPLWTWRVTMNRDISNPHLIWWGIRWLGGSCYGQRGKW